MLRPTPGELLAGVRRELTEQVLPVVPAGGPARQLKAALHVLAQLERTWDLQPAYLAADNADLHATLAEFATRTGITPSPHADRADVVPGVHDEGLAAAIRENDRLQAELDEVQQAWRAAARDDPAVDRLVFDLHVRMAARASAAAGLA